MKKRVQVNTVIGIDPGLASTGIGVVQGKGLHVSNYAFGTIRTRKEDSLPERLEQIYRELGKVLQNRKPDLMIVEDVFSLERYPKSGISLGKVCGVILLAGFQAELKTIEIPVREAKKILTGNGNATKAQLEQSVRRSIGRCAPIGSFHASDALGLALIGLFRYGGSGIFNQSHSICLKSA